MGKPVDEIRTMDSRKYVPSFTFLLLIVFVFISLHFSFLYSSVTVEINSVAKPSENRNLSSEGSYCPEHFRWIHEDLRPWKSGGIDREVVGRSEKFADFKLIILKGKVYVEKFRDSYQTRDVFTVWGILQLLRLYPDGVPDVELLFHCGDRPDDQSLDATLPPLVFYYSKAETESGILFPDWTFWGWAEVNVKPWESMLQSIVEANKKMKWKDREPYAYWRGNPNVNYLRPSLMQCNVSQKYDWNARLYEQEWDKEAKQGFKNSNIADQCKHRYKIYIEGWGWSVSEKYILACDSMVLFMKPKFYDFFTRSLVPMHHFWPISRAQNKCRDIKLAVDWGNNHTHQAQEIGKAGSKFIQENLKMHHVYDYMFHVLNEYAKLQKFEPVIPQGAEEISVESLLKPQKGVWRKFMEESAVKSPKKQAHCTMPPPYNSRTLKAILNRRQSTYKKVETWGEDQLIL
ncbi:uncharacterized protein [Euphorbia lathyris]|uniref:uncharacterized protein n=1 Tax=Euphorbia lathyris TaxID=212925 RepID=UPI003313DF29